MNATFTESFLGWTHGYHFTTQDRAAREILQGKNYYLAAGAQFGQINTLAHIIQKINHLFPNHSFKTPIHIFTTVVSFLSLPALLLSASVKHGDYDAVAKAYNSWRYSYIKLPEKLSSFTIAAANFTSEHIGNMARVAIVAGLIGIAILGNIPFAATFLTAMTYSIADQMGFIPFKISLFMEIHMPFISHVGLLIGGTLIQRVISAVYLPSSLISTLQTYLHEKVDAIMRGIFKIKRASLKEINAPVIEKTEMSYQEIVAILEKNFDDFEINPSHCSKPLIDMEKLPTDRQFNKFLTLFDSIDWKAEYPIVVKKLKGDDRFIDFLSSKYPNQNKKDLKANVETFIEKLANEKGISKEEFALNWTREQMVSFVDILLVKKPVKGLKQDLKETMENCSILLPYLMTLKNPKELADALLKLGLEGGEYCARGLKRASNEALYGILQGGIPQEISDDPKKNYEMQVLQTLQNCRFRIMQNFYKTTFQKNLNIPDTLTDDVHGFDIYRLYFSLGFFPITPYEKRRISVVEIYIWEMYADAIQAMHKAYRSQLDETLKETGEIHFGQYLMNIINTNKLLTDQQKEDLIDKFIMHNNGKWTVEETIEKFHRLLFVRLGVLRTCIKPIQS